LTIIIKEFNTHFVFLKYFKEKTTNEILSQLSITKLSIGEAISALLDFKKRPLGFPNAPFGNFKKRQLRFQNRPLRFEKPPHNLKTRCLELEAL
jgi:hypothetical protein